MESDDREQCIIQPPTTQPNTSADNSLVASLTQPERHILSYVQPPTQTLQPPPSFDAHYDSHKRIEAAQTGIQHSQPPPQRTDRTAPSEAQKADKPPDISSVRSDGGQTADRDGDISCTSKLTHPLRIKYQETVRHRKMKRSSLRSEDKTSDSLNALGAHYLEGRKQRLKKFLSNIAAVMKFGLRVDTYWGRPTQVADAALQCGQ